MHNNRDFRIDYLRGMAVLLMVLGHAVCDQYNGTDYINDNLFTLIYSFHMPLFMVISGYLFPVTQQKGIIHTLKAIARLFIPIFVFGNIKYIISILKGECVLSLREEILAITSNGYWYFWVCLLIMLCFECIDILRIKECVKNSLLVMGGYCFIY